MPSFELGPEQWQRLKPLLTAAVRLPAAERSPFFERHLGSDPALRSCALEMLRVYDASPKPFTASGTSPSLDEDAPTRANGGAGPDAPSPPLAAGRTIGHYRVVRKLGEGGMGRVYLAVDDRLGRQVALKSLGSPAAPALGDSRARVISESRSIAALNHPGIVVLYDVFEHDEELLLVMEYVEGRPLSESIAAGPIATAFALRLIEQIADALAYAHARGVLHCDLKPANIHLLPSGGTKILDFGLARILASHPDEEETAPRQIVGTLGYLSPEQLSFRPPTAASDVYALGVVSYELLTGTRPFVDGDEGQLLFDTVSAAPAPPSAVMASLPVDVDEMVLRCLAKNPRDRLQAHEIAAAVRALGSRGVDSTIRATSDAAARPNRAVQRSRRWGPAWMAVATLGVLALVLGLAANWSGIWARRLLSTPASTSEQAASVPPIALAILPTVGTLSRPEDAAMGRAIPALLRMAMSRAGDLNVLLLEDEPAAADAPPDAAMKALGATSAIRCRLGSGNGADIVEVELFQRDSADRVFHATAPFDPESFPRTFERIVQAVERGIATHLRPPSRAENPTPASQLLPSGLALSHFTEALDMLDRYDVTGNVQRAVTLLESAIEKDPSSAVAYAALAKAQWTQYREQTRDAEHARRATASAMTALTLNSSLLSVRLTAAMIQRGTGALDQAERTLTDAIASAPASDEAHKLLGELLAEKAQYERAQREFDIAVTLRPLYWGNHRAKGLAYYNAGDYERAVRSFTRVTELQPDSPFGFQMLGAALHQLGRYADALSSYERALKLGPHAPTWSNIGKLHYDNTRYEEAVAAYREALKIRATSPLTWRGLGDVFSAMGRTADAQDAYQQAEEYAARALRVSPSNASNLSMLAVIHAKLGRHKEAAEEINRAVALSPDDPLIQFRRAIVSMLAGRRDEAQAAVDRAIALGYSPIEAKLDRDLRGLKVETP